MKGGAWCNMRHDRAGIVSNRDLADPAATKDGPLASVTVCEREACIRKGLRLVAGETNETATYYADAERAPRQTEATS